MKILSVTIAILSATTTIKGQPERNVINFRSYAISTCLTPAHGVCFATRVGEVVVPDQQPGTWRQANPVQVQGKGVLSETLIDNISFFNNDTGFVSGFIKDGSSVYNIYYHTTDGGRHWEKRRFPDAGWADVVVHLNNGKAWASIAGSGHIDYSSDYGLTWQQLNVPHEKERYAAIFFNSQSEGLIGSLWNVIAYTPDNGKTWRDILSPLSQHAYQKTNIGTRPEINRVAIFQSYFIVEQEGQVFVSLKDSIHWLLLPYEGFIADNNTNTLFFTRKNTVTKAGNKLSPVATYTVNGGAGIGKYNNGQLALWSGSELTTIDDDGAMASTRLYTNEAKVLNPTCIGFDIKNGIVGYMGNEIYTQKGNSDDWVYKSTLPFPVQGRPLQVVGQDSLLVKGPGDSLLYYDLKTGKSTYTTAATLMIRFCSNAVQKVIFECGSQGCFHAYADNVIYERDGNAFVLAHNVSTGSKHKKSLSDYPDEIQAAFIDSFIRKLPTALSVQPTIATIGITAKDFDQCQKDIRAFQSYVNAGKVEHGDEEEGFRMYKNNIDFDRLLSLSGSVASMQPATVDSLLYNTSGLWSTTTNWVGMRFVLANGETLSIVNQFYKPNSLHFPWRIELKGYTLDKNIVDVNQFIENAYPRFIDNKGHADIVELFVKYLYGED